MPRLLLLASLLVASAVSIPGAAHAGPSAAGAPRPRTPRAAPVVHPTPRDDHYYVGLGGELGADILIRFGAAAEVAYRPWSRPLWFRAKAGIGTATNFSDGFRVHEGALGIEGQRCSYGIRFCWFAGVDAGVVRMSGNHGIRAEPYDEMAPSIMPRGGFDIGATIRLRFLLQGRLTWFDQIHELRPGLAFGLSILGRF